MDIQRAFTFITEDERWLQKLAIGVGLILASMILSAVLVGILGYLILAGYTIRLLQNVRDGVGKPLPEWDDWGGDLSRGFKYAVVGFIWALPIILLTVPSSIGGALADGGGDFGGFVGGVIVIFSSCLSFVYGIFIALAQPGFTISFARDEKISSGLMLTDIWQWTRSNLGQVVIAALVVLGATLALMLGASVIGVLLCVIGLIITLPLAMLAMTLVQHHLYGQLARSYPMYPPRPAPVTPPSSAPVMPADSGLDMPNRDTGLDAGVDAEVDTPAAGSAMPPVDPTASGLSDASAWEPGTTEDVATSSVATNDVPTEEIEIDTGTIDTGTTDTGTTDTGTTDTGTADDATKPSA